MFQAHVNLRLGNRITTYEFGYFTKKAKATSIRMLINLVLNIFLFFRVHFFIRQHVLFAQQQIFEKHFSSTVYPVSRP